MALANLGHSTQVVLVSGPFWPLGHSGLRPQEVWHRRHGHHENSQVSCGQYLSETLTIPTAEVLTYLVQLYFLIADMRKTCTNTVKPIN